MVVEIRLESNVYNVNESAGDVEICSIVSPAEVIPVLRTLVFYVDTKGTTAGKLS